MGREVKKGGIKVSINNRDELVSYLSTGAKVKYIFFWGHQSDSDEVTKTCLSQWYIAPFISEGITFMTAEHFMMAEKAKLFSDYDAMERIILANEPGKAKRIGREIRHFNEDIWLKHRVEIVIKANTLKFEQNAELKIFLLKTGNRVLVEASPVDTIWGVGVAADNLKINDPAAWRGLNLLGFSLMAVRDKLIG